MKVRMYVQLSGSRDGVEWPAPGEIVDLPDDEALQYLNSGVCVPVADSVVEDAGDPGHAKAEKAAGRK